MSSPLIFALSSRPALRGPTLSPLRILGLSLVALGFAIPAFAEPAEQVIHGSVHDSEGAPIVGAMISLRQGSPFHERTVFTDHAGAYQSTLAAGDPFTVRVRRIGWRDQDLFQEANGELQLVFPIVVRELRRDGFRGGGWRARVRRHSRWPGCVPVQ